MLFYLRNTKISFFSFLFRGLKNTPCLRTVLKKIAIPSKNRELGICTCVDVPAGPEIFFEIFMGRFFHIAKFSHLWTRTSRPSYTTVGDTLFYRYYSTLSIPVRWKICFTRNLGFEMEGIWSEHGKTVWMNASTSPTTIVLPACHKRKMYSIFYILSSLNVEHVKNLLRNTKKSTMKKPSASYSHQQAKWNSTHVSSNILVTSLEESGTFPRIGKRGSLFLNYGIIDRFSNSSTFFFPFFLLLSLWTDKVLDDEFLSILKQCNIYPGNRNVPESPCISENHLQWDEESLHSSILDSTNSRDSLGTLEDRHSIVTTTMKNSTRMKRSGVISGCDFFPCKFRGWKGRRRTKPKLVLVSEQHTDDTKSPLLNPNAIHERRSLNMLNIEEDRSCDEQQENTVHQILTRENQSVSTTIDLDPPATASSSSSPATAPLIRVISPSFARHPRQWNFRDLVAFTSCVKKVTSPSNYQLQVSKSSSSRICARSWFDTEQLCTNDACTPIVCMEHTIRVELTTISKWIRSRQEQDNR